MRVPPARAGVIIVLGSPNDDQGRLHSVALERCEQALRLHRANPCWPLLLTGGHGAHFNTTTQPHAEYLRRWLIAHGAGQAHFLRLAESRNTLEDASLTKPILLEYGARVALIVTSDYHVDRARFVFEREFADTSIVPCFVSTSTDESATKLDIAALKAHERRALARLRDEIPPSR